MERRAPAVLRGCLLVGLLAATSGTAGAQRGAAARFEHLPSAEPQPPASPRDGQAIFDARGRAVAWRRPVAVATDPVLAARAPLQITTGADAGGRSFEAPAYRRWLATPDGRSVLGAGDPSAPEHPFELHYALYRDGERQLLSDAPLATESLFALDVGGRLAIAGHAPAERGVWFVGEWSAQGEPLRRATLPAADEVLGLVAQAGSVFALTRDAVGTGRLWRLGTASLDELLTLEGPQQLLGLEQGSALAVRSATALLWVDGASGAVRWRAEVSLRPAGPYAWAWLAPGDDHPGLLAVVTGALRRAGTPRAPARLVCFDVRDGTSLATLELPRAGPLALARLRPGGAHLVLDWMGTREVFAWSR